MANGTEKYLVPGYGVIDVPVGSTPQERTAIANKTFGYNFTNYSIVPYHVPERVNPQPPPKEEGGWFYRNVGRHVERGIDLTQATLDGLSAIVADVLDAPEWKQHALEDYQAEMQQVADNPGDVPSWTDIHSVGDAIQYLYEGLLEQLPLMVPTLLTGGAGATIGGNVARGFAEKAVAKEAKTMLEQLITRKTADLLPKALAKGIPKELAEVEARNAAIEFFTRPAAQAILNKAIARSVAKGTGTGTALGAWAGSTALEAGSIAGDQFMQTGDIDPATALGYGAAAGLLDALPAVMVLKKVFGPATEQIKSGLVKRFGLAGAKQLLAEGSTEFVQTFIEQMGVSALTGEDVFTEETFNQAVDAALKAGGAGFVMGVGAEGLRKTQPPPSEKPSAAATQRGVDPSGAPGSSQGQTSMDAFKGVKIPGSIQKFGKGQNQTKVHFTNPTMAHGMSVDHLLYNTSRLSKRKGYKLDPEVEATLENNYGKNWRLVGENFVNAVNSKRAGAAAGQVTSVNPLAGSKDIVANTLPSPLLDVTQTDREQQNKAFGKLGEKAQEAELYANMHGRFKPSLLTLQEMAAAGKSDAEIAKALKDPLDASFKTMDIPNYDQASEADKIENFTKAVQVLRSTMGIPDQKSSDYAGWKLGHDIITGKKPSPTPTPEAKKAMAPPPPKDRLDRVALAWELIKRKQWENLKKRPIDAPDQGLSRDELFDIFDQTGLRKTDSKDRASMAGLIQFGANPIDLMNTSLGKEGAPSPFTEESRRGSKPTIEAKVKTQDEILEIINELSDRTYKPVRPKAFLPGMGELESMPTKQRAIEKLWSWIRTIDDKENGVPLIRFELAWAGGVDPLKNTSAYMDHWPKLLEYLTNQGDVDFTQADPKVVRRKILSTLRLIQKKLELPSFDSPEYDVWRADILKHYRSKSRLTKEIKDKIKIAATDKFEGVSSLRNPHTNPTYYFNHHLLKVQDLTEDQAKTLWPSMGQPLRIEFSINDKTSTIKWRPISEPASELPRPLFRESRAPENQEQPPGDGGQRHVLTSGELAIDEEMKEFRENIVGQNFHEIDLAWPPKSNKQIQTIMTLVEFGYRYMAPELKAWYGLTDYDMRTLLDRAYLHDVTNKGNKTHKWETILQVLNTLYAITMDDPLSFNRMKLDSAKKIESSLKFSGINQDIMKIDNDFVIKNHIRENFYAGLVPEIYIESTNLRNVDVDKSHLQQTLQEIGIDTKTITVLPSNNLGGLVNVYRINIFDKRNASFHKRLNLLEPGTFARVAVSTADDIKKFNVARKKLSDVVQSLIGKNLFVYTERNPKIYSSVELNKMHKSSIDAQGVFLPASVTGSDNAFERAFAATIRFNFGIDHVPSYEGTTPEKTQLKLYGVAAHEAWHAWFEMVRLFGFNPLTEQQNKKLINNRLIKDFMYMESEKGREQLMHLLNWAIYHSDAKEIWDGGFHFGYIQGYRSRIENLKPLNPKHFDKLRREIIDEAGTRLELQADMAAFMYTAHKLGIQFPQMEIAPLYLRILDFFSRLGANIAALFNPGGYNPNNIGDIYSRYVTGNMLSDVEEFHSVMAEYTRLTDAEHIFKVALGDLKFMKSEGGGGWTLGHIASSYVDEEGNPVPVWVVKISNMTLEMMATTEKGIPFTTLPSTIKYLREAVSFAYGHTFQFGTTVRGLKAWLNEPDAANLKPNVRKFLADTTVGLPDHNPLIDYEFSLEDVIKLTGEEVRQLLSLPIFRKLQDVEVFASRRYIDDTLSYSYNGDTFETFKKLRNVAEATLGSNYQIKPNPSAPMPAISGLESPTPKSLKDEASIVTQDASVGITFDANNLTQIKSSESQRKAMVGRGLKSLKDMISLSDKPFEGTVNLGVYSKYIRHMHDLAAEYEEFALYWVHAHQRQQDRTYTLEGMMVDTEKQKNRLKALSELPRSSRENIFRALEVARRLNVTHLEKNAAGTYQIAVPMEDPASPYAMYGIKAKPGEIIQLSKKESEALDMMTEGLSFGLDQIIKAYKVQKFANANISLDKIKQTIAEAQQIVQALKDLDHPEFERLKAELDNLVDLADSIETLESYKGRHWMPLVRNGDMGLTVHKKRDDGSKGDLVFFKTFDKTRAGKRDWNATYAKLKADFPEDQFLISDKAFDLSDNYVRLSATDALGALESLASLLDSKMREKYENVHKVLVEEAMRRGFHKHLTHSKNIPGYDDDIILSYAKFVNGVANFSANVRYKNAINHALNILRKHPDLSQIAEKMENYVTGTADELSYLRNMGFLMYLGFNLGSAVLQLFTLPMIFLPYVSQFMSPMKALLGMKSLWRNIAWTKGKPFKALGVDNPAVQQDLNTLFQQGFLQPMMTLDQAGFSVNARSHSRRWFDKNWQKMVQASGYFFNTAETAARTTAAKIILQQAHSDPKFMDRFNAAHAKDKLWQVISRESGATPLNAAIHVMEKTFGVYGKISRPAYMRGGLPSAIFQFTTYPQQMIELSLRLLKGTSQNKKAFAFTMLALIAVGGLQGLPGAENLKTLAEAIYKTTTGKDIDLETEFRQIVMDYTGSADVGQILMRGAVPRALGADIGRRVALGSIPSVENILNIFGAYGTDSKLDGFGVAGSLLQIEPFFEALRNRTSVWEAMGKAPFVPTAFKNLLDASYLWDTNGVRADAGDQLLKPEEFDLKSQIFKAIGFNPILLAERRAASRAMRREGRSLADTKSDYYDKLATAKVRQMAALSVGDSALASDYGAEYRNLLNEIREYNRGADRADRIQIDSDYLKSLIKRMRATDLKGIIKSLPKQSQRKAKEIMALYNVTPS